MEENTKTEQFQSLDEEQLQAITGGTEKDKAPSNGEWSSIDHYNHAKHLQNVGKELLLSGEKEHAQRIVDMIHHHLDLYDRKSLKESILATEASSSKLKSQPSTSGTKSLSK